MNKIFRTKSNLGGLSVRLDQIVSIQYSSNDITGSGETYSVEINTMYGPKDATLTGPELEELQRAWDAAL